MAQGNLALSFSVAPSVRDVRVLLKCEGELLYELNAVGVEDVRCHKDKGQEALAVVLNTHDSIWLQIKPKIVINHYAKERT